MNFRLNLAVALAAAMTFACADKQAAIPELEEAMKAPEGRVVLGVYRMDVTPVEGTGGRQFYLQPVAVGRDGNALTNPPNTIQINGVFSGITTAGPGGCAGVNALTAPVTITNFMADPLSNVWVDITSMVGTGQTACNSTLYTRDTNRPLQFNTAAMTQGIWWYGPTALAGAPGPTLGQLAGGSATPANATVAPETSGVWGIRWTGTSGRFFFRVTADNNAPVPVSTDPVTTGTALTWTSQVSNTSQFQICATNPGLGVACPAPIETAPVGSASPVAPFAFSYVPAAALQNGVTYYWSVANTYATGTTGASSQWTQFTFTTAVPVATPATFPANVLASNGGALLEIAYTVDAAWPSSWAVMCVGGCPAARTVPPAANVVFDAVNPSLYAPTYYLDVTALLSVDALTATYLDPAVTYDIRFYNYDGTANVPNYADPHGVGSVTVTPVQLAPVIAPAPVFSAAATTWPVTWTADPVFLAPSFPLGFVGTWIDICVPNCVADPPPNPSVPAGGLQVLAGVGGVYTLDLLPLVSVNLASLGLPVTAGQAFEFDIYNADLYQTYGSVNGGTVVP